MKATNPPFKKTRLFREVDFFFKNIEDPIPNGQRYQLALLHENGIDISRKQFSKFRPYILKTKVPKTGGMNCDQQKVLECIKQRAIYGINQENTLALDEKLFYPKKASDSCCVVHASHKGVVKGKYKKATAGFINLELCISSKGVVTYKLLRESTKVDDFNAFINQIMDVFPRYLCAVPHFIVLDNGSFHQVSKETEEKMSKLQFSFSWDAPLACFLNPAEEFFAALNNRVNEMLASYNSITLDHIEAAIEVAIEEEWTDTFIRSIFKHAAISPPPYELLEPNSLKFTPAAVGHISEITINELTKQPYVKTLFNF